MTYICPMIPHFSIYRVSCPSPIVPSIPDVKVSDLNLSDLMKKSLQGRGVHTLSQIVQNDLHFYSSIRGVGKKRVVELIDMLYQDYGLHLKKHSS